MNRKLQVHELNRINAKDYADILKLPVIVFLDNVRSLLNVGSVFRNADAFGVSEVYLCGITGTPPDREIRKTALGAEQTVKWTYTDQIISTLNKFKEIGYKIYAVEQATHSVKLHQFEPNSSHPIILIFGNEVDGVQQEVIDICDGCIEIPQFGTKHSINVSVSSGVVLWHVFSSLFLTEDEQ